MKRYKAKEGETIWTISNLLYGSVSYAFKLASDNGLELNDTLQGIELQYDETIKETVLQPFTVSFNQTNTNQIYIGLSNQSIFDVSMQTIGSLESVVSLVRNSNMLSVNEDVTLKTFSYTDSGNSVKKYIGATGRVFANKPVPADNQLREHDDSFNRLQYT